MSDRLSIGVLGADGRMGREIIRAIAARATPAGATPPVRGVILAAAFTQDSSPHLGADAGAVAGLRDLGVALTPFSADALASCDALIDFSRPEATRTAVIAMGVSPCQTIVTGTTGQSESELAELTERARGLRFLRAGNFSLGVNLMEALVEQAARALSSDYDIEIDEAHHRHKVDAPSGTALMLGEAAATGRNIDHDPVTDRTGAREDNAIGYSVRRAGGIIGEHEVSFTSELERLSIAHSALDRSVFAQGALSAALWLSDQTPGHYTMRDVLGL